MTNTLALLQSEHKYMFLLGDYNVDISAITEIQLATEEFNNILSSEHFFSLFNKPTYTTESKHSLTIIDNISCNIPSTLEEMRDVGILRPNVLYDTTHSNYQHSCIKCNLCRERIHNFANT